ncbi:MAG TPA: hypothetical protein DCM08_04420 [Microscillaceae bacterium]|nr:hypothetical protein [Microscillaceae bacterium]
MPTLFLLLLMLGCRFVATPLYAQKQSSPSAQAPKNNSENRQNQAQVAQTNTLNPTYVGIPSEVLNYYAAAQQKQNWCWAACIQMLFNYYGVDIDQASIVKRTYGQNYRGDAPDVAATYEAIYLNLNNWSIDAQGKKYVVKAQMGYGSPPPDEVIDELKQGRPVLVGYRTGEATGHAVLITALSYVDKTIGSVVVRDPYPTAQNIQNYGRVEYDAASLMRQVEVYWFVRVYPQ